MSKNYPDAKSKWDAYLAFPDQLQISQVILATKPSGKPCRIVIGEDYTSRRDEWESEIRRQVRGDGRLPTMAITSGNESGIFPLGKVVEEIGVPPEAIYLYGGDYI